MWSWGPQGRCGLFHHWGPPPPSGLEKSNGSSKVTRLVSGRAASQQKPRLGFLQTPDGFQRPVLADELQLPALSGAPQPP